MASRVVSTSRRLSRIPSISRWRSSSRARLFFKNQIGTALCVADDALRLLLRVRFDVVGKPLRRDQRALEAALLLAVLVDNGFHAHEILAEAFGFPQRPLVVVGDGQKKRSDFDLVVPSERITKFVLPEVNWTDIHS